MKTQRTILVVGTDAGEPAMRLAANRIPLDGSQKTAVIGSFEACNRSRFLLLSNSGVH